VSDPILAFMGHPSFPELPNSVRATFARLKELRDQAACAAKSHPPMAAGLVEVEDAALIIIDATRRSFPLHFLVAQEVNP
jgi:hypothetical protein